ncbi:MAG: hypothetical protein KBD37_04470 [Burkholderiales bacterium]|nr:hypothetical protein [Burkholderiales bacterium]
MAKIDEFLELRIFIEQINVPLIKIYMKNLWATIKKSEELTDIYLTNNAPTQDILKIRNEVIKYKKLIREGNGINIFGAQKSLQLEQYPDFLTYQKTPIFKKRKVYSLSNNSKIELGKIQVFDQKYYTACIEALNITDFIFLFNKIGMHNLLHAALKNSKNQIINGYNQFLTHLSSANTIST